MITPSIRFQVVIRPNRVKERTALVALEQGKLINSLRRCTQDGHETYIWTFLVPKEHLRRVEWTLQRKYIPYRKNRNEETS